MIQRLRSLILHVARLLGFKPPKAEAVPPRAMAGDDDFRRLTFTYAVIALSAKIACCDGRLTRDKYIAFREAFPLSGGMCGKIRSLFALACENPTPFEHYVMQIKYTFRGRNDLFASLLDRLFRIAAPEGQLEPEAERMLGMIANGLGLPHGDYLAIRKRYEQPARRVQKQAHHILGVVPGAGAGLLKKRYRELMHRYHPDRYADHALSPEVELLLQLKTSEINEAYRSLRVVG